MAAKPSSYPTRRVPPEKRLPIPGGAGDGSRSAALPKSNRLSRSLAHKRLPGFTDVSRAIETEEVVVRCKCAPYDKNEKDMSHDLDALYCSHGFLLRSQEETGK